MRDDFSDITGLLNLVWNAFLYDSITRICITILAILFVVWFFIRPNYASRTIKKRLKELKGVSSGDIHDLDDDFKNWIAQYFVVNQVAPDGKSCLQLSSEKKALLKVPAEDVINLTSPYHGESNMPSLMSTIGVLGTFAGVTVGIQPLDIGLSQGSEDLLKGASVLIDGMKTAFVTSLIGLALAALSMFLLSQRQKQYRSHSSAWVKELQELAVLADPFSSLIALASPERQKADQAAIQAAQAMGEAAQTMQHSLSGFNADVIGEQVALSIGAVLQDKMMPVFHSMESSLSGIQERMASQNEEVLEALIVNLRTEVIEPLANRVHESVQVTAEVAKAVDSLHKELNGLEDAMTSTVKRIVEAGSELVNQSEKMLNSKQQIQELLEAVGATKASMMNQLNETAKHLGGSVSGLYDQYETLNHTVQEQMTGIMHQNEKYLSDVEERHQRLFHEHDKYTKDILQHIEQATNHIAAIADDIRDSVTDMQQQG